MNISVQYCTIGPCALAINDRCNNPKENRIKKEEFKGGDQVKQKGPKQKKQILLTSMNF